MAAASSEPTSAPEPDGFDPPGRRVVLAIWRVLRGPEVAETY